MKFLVLALCVCAASAANFGGYNNFNRGYPNPAVATANAAAVASVPAAVAAKTVVEAAAPVYTPVSQTAVKEAEAPILRQDSDVGVEGYKYAYETGNGISAESSGVLDQATGSVVSQGAYRYTSPEGKVVEIVYTADENGFHPKGDVLPVAPEIPAAILRAIAYTAAHPQTEDAKKF